MDPRDVAAAQDRAARLDALRARAGAIAQLDESDVPDAGNATATGEDRPRRIVGYYRGQPVFADDAPPATPVASRDPHRMTHYRGQRID